MHPITLITLFSIALQASLFFAWEIILFFFRILSKYWLVSIINFHIECQKQVHFHGRLMVRCHQSLMLLSKTYLFSLLAVDGLTKPVEHLHVQRTETLNGVVIFVSLHYFHPHVFNFAMNLYFVVVDAS